MAEGQIIRFHLPDETGKRVAIRLSLPQARDFLNGIIQAIGAMPQEPGLEVEAPLEASPPRATGLAVTPIDGAPNLARVSIFVGAVDLQIAVPLEALMDQLDDLKRQTEPDPTSPRRPN